MRIQADKIVASIATVQDCGSYSSSRDSKAAVLDTPMLKSRGVVRWRFAVSATSKYGYTEIDFQYSSSSTTQGLQFSAMKLWAFIRAAQFPLFAYSMVVLRQLFKLRIRELFDIDHFIVGTANRTDYFI